MYRANIMRASSGEKDNSPIIEKVLSLKQEKAKLLGYANFAEVSMASKVSASLRLHCHANPLSTHSPATPCCFVG